MFLRFGKNYNIQRRGISMYILSNECKIARTYSEGSRINESLKLPAKVPREA